MKSLFTLLVWSFFTLTLAAQAGYQISVQIDGFQKDTLYLGYYLGDKQYLKDTVARAPGKAFVFSGKEELAGGVYLVILPPDNNFFQFIVNPGEQQLSFKTDVKDLVANMQLKGSKDNQLFYDYLHFLSAKRPVADELNKALKEAGQDEAKRKPIQQKLENLNQEVKAYQQKVVAENPKSLTAALIKANWEVDFPAYTGTEEEVQVKRWRYMQQHVFDNLDLADPRLLRSPFLFERIDYFVHKLHVQHPDTIAWAIDYILEKTRPAEETFRFYLVHYLNEAARSKFVGMDAVYVNLVEKYYKTGQAKWTDKESMKKIVENSDAIKPLLIGKIAPNITTQRRDGSKVSLHEVDADYTVLYFWRYDCGHCKESTPVLKKFYEKYKDKSVRIFTVCVKYTDEVPPCWQYVDDNQIGDWIHTVDPYHLSKFSSLYNIKTTPQLYVLDRKKEIISKSIAADQLEEVMDRIIEMKQQDKSKMKD